MAKTEYVDNIEMRPHSGQMFAYIDGRILGRVSRVDDGVHVRLMGSGYRNQHMFLNDAPGT